MSVFIRKPPRPKGAVVSFFILNSILLFNFLISSFLRPTSTFHLLLSK
jgi:hypothetical protein